MTAAGGKGLDIGRPNYDAGMIDGNGIRAQHDGGERQMANFRPASITAMEMANSGGRNRQLAPGNLLGGLAF